MEFIKTEKGWLNLETEQLTLFGDLAAALWGTLRETFEYINEKIDQYYNFSSDCSLVRIIGRNDFLGEFEQTLFSKDTNIAAIMLFLDSIPLGAIPPDNSLPYLGHDIFFVKENHRYLPIYYSDLEQMFNGLNNYNYDVLYHRTEEEMMMLLSYLANGEYGHIYNTDEENKKYIIKRIDEWLPTLNDQPIPTLIRKHKNQYRTAFVVDNIGQLYGRDILELINFKYSIGACPICRKMFVKRDGRTNFCPKCSADKKAQKRYNDQKRKRNTIQIEHKAIVDMLRNRNENYNDFVNESYYYKDLIEGKEISSCPTGYDASIQTKEQYEDWLKQKHKELTKRPKKSPTR